MCDHQRDHDAGKPTPPDAAPCRTLTVSDDDARASIQTHNAGVAGSSPAPAIVGQRLTLRPPNSATTGATTAPKKARNQAVQTAYHREWRKGAGREKFAAALKRSHAKYPERQRAWWRVAYALKTGKLVKGPCEIGGDCAGRIEAHHDDYTQPLEVRWVCKRHHAVLDARRSAA